MTALRVVEHLDVIEDIPACRFPVAIGLSPDALPLEQLEEALDDSVVVTVPAPAHAGHQVVCLQEGLPVVAAELAALVRMYQHLLRGLAAPDGHQQGADGQLSGHPLAHRPADDLA